MNTITTQKTERRFTTRTGERANPSCSATAGRSPRTTGTDRCCSSASVATESSQHDRRGHGRSTQTWDGNDMDTYADDLAALTEKLDLKNAIHVGHSTGGGEVARYIGRHGTKRVAMAVLISAVPPLMVKTDKNPAGAPIEVFDDLRAQYAKNRPQFYKDITLPFYGYNRPGAKISEGIREKWWLQGMMGGMKAGYDCIKAFSETDFTEDLKKFDVPTLILHGDDDQIVPIGAAALQSAKLVKNATLKVYPGLKRTDLRCNGPADGERAGAGQQQ